jgi:soluble lytic murein transglycosylase
MTLRGLGTAVAIVALLIGAGLVVSGLNKAARNRGLPLSDTAIIREQAAAKHLDPALIAAVIYAESKFEPRPSPAGAQGLMQILPATAYYLAHLSGGKRFTATDLATPRINVAYGSYYLRYLLNEYHGNTVLALAAYNGGETNVDNWVRSVHKVGQRFRVGDIPFPETRAYVQRVLSARAQYRRTYASALGYT